MTPIQARRPAGLLRISSITGRASSIAIAKPTFSALPLRGDGVDADQPAGGVDERAAGVAGVDRGVGLQQPLERRAAVGVHRAVEPGDDALRDGRAAAEVEREADREHAVAEPELRRAPERNGDEIVERRRG